jgi:hypothetical protein
MFITVDEWTINTEQITYIFHHKDGSIEFTLWTEKRLAWRQTTPENFARD